MYSITFLFLKKIHIYNQIILYIFKVTFSTIYIYVYMSVTIKWNIKFTVSKQFNVILHVYYYTMFELFAYKLYFYKKKNNEIFFNVLFSIFKDNNKFSILWLL